MRAVDIIVKKRSGGELDRREIEFLLGSYVRGEVPDYQVSAWLMAVFLQGMTIRETGALTEVMLKSGAVILLRGHESPELRGPFVDKHSTGGVGDKVSLPLAPIVAACGVQVPMMSGRALGHTGGTLDKLESIAGYRVNLSPEEFRAGIAANGFAMMGQTRDIVPADRLLYALRDVTGTVESIPLITASILSKKIAEGSDALVFDVKYGTGAFMKTIPGAEALAESLVSTATAMGKKVSALITNMNSPLGRKIGNFLEIEESVEILHGAADSGLDELRELTFALGAEMLVLGGKAVDVDEGVEQCRRAVASGKALELFLANIRTQGGDPDKILGECGKRRSPHRTLLKARQDGYITVDAYRVGLAGVTLGVGRNRTEDAVCADAGVILLAGEGDPVRRGDALMEIYGKDQGCLAPAAEALGQAVGYHQTPPARAPLIYGRKQI
ncbi:MAG: thymidine phosphorylase [Spirochaetaceae bacterium]|nr:thymidine phosphorylase [Spirochaetaceae bacterium]